jgi:hypothetical protein
MANKTPESYGKHTNSEQTERTLKRLSRRLSRHLTCDFSLVDSSPYPASRYQE